MLGGRIRKFIDDGNPAEWDLYLPQALFACRIHTLRITGASPFYLLYGLKPKIPGDASRPKMCHERPTDEELVQWRELLNSKIKAERNEASERLKKNQAKSKACFDRQVVPVSVAEGDLVMLKNESPKKFEVNWGGPYWVKRIDRDNAALIKLESLENEQLPNWINLA